MQCTNTVLRIMYDTFTYLFYSLSLFTHNNKILNIRIDVFEIDYGAIQHTHTQMGDVIFCFGLNWRRIECKGDLNLKILCVWYVGLFASSTFTTFHWSFFVFLLFCLETIKSIRWKVLAHIHMKSMLPFTCNDHFTWLQCKQTNFK